MSPQQVDNLIKELKELGKQQNPEVFDDMIRVANDLTKWRTEDMRGELPHQDKLREWGLLKDGEQAQDALNDRAARAAPRTLSAANIDETIAALRARLTQLQDEGEEESSEYTELNTALSGLLRWKRSGMQEPASHLDTLERWEIYPFAPNRPSRANAVPVSPSSETSVPAAGADVVDSDSAYEDRYREAEQKLEGGFYYEARNIFRELQPKVRGRLRAPVQNGLTKANTSLNQRTTYLVEQAHIVERQEKKNLARQKDAWLAVLKENPDSQEANDAVTKLTQEMTDQEVRGEIRGLSEQAKKAAQDENLPTLNKMLGEVEGLRRRGEATPPEISKKLYDELVNLEQEVTKLRAEVRKKLGQSSTLLTGGYYRDAYENARNYMNRAVPVMIDEAGYAGPAGQEVETTRFFALAREQFLTSLRNLVAQRLEKAAGEEKESPAIALETLQDAETRLTDNVLTDDDKRTLLELLDQVQKRIAEVNKTLARYNDAKAKILQAQESGTTARKALELYRAAETHYADYPELKLRIVETEAAVAAVIAAELAADISEAQRKMKQDQYDAAFKLLQTARDRATNEVPHPKPNSELARRLEEITRVEAEIRDAEARYEQMMVVLREFDTHIEQFRKGDTVALQLAENKLETLTDEEKKHHQARGRMSDLVALRGDAGNWEKGTREYRRQNWEEAELSLSKVANSQDPNQAEARRLANRAQACLAVAKARQAETEAKWKEAVNNYKTATDFFTKNGTDELTAPIAEEAREGLERLKPIARNDEVVQRKLNEAKRLLKQVNSRIGRGSVARTMVQPMPEFEQAFTLVNEAEQMESTLADQADELKQEIREQWRRAFLNGMKAAARSNDLEVLQAGIVLAETLRDQALLFDIEEEQLVRDLEERYLDTEYAQLIEASPKEWERIEANRQRRRRALRNASPEISEQYMNALRERIKEQANHLKSQDPLAARAYLKQELEKLSLQADEELARRAFDLCWELEDWEEADRLANELDMNYPEESAAWKGLTRAARLYHGGLVHEASAEIEELKERYKQNERLTLLLREKEQKFREKTLDVLQAQANELILRGGEDDWIAAATKYALMYEINERDIRARRGLEQVGKRVEPGLKKLLRRADGLTIGSSSLDETLHEADALYETLHSLHTVASANRLPLPADLKAQLSGTYTRLAAKRDRWKAVQDYLNRAQMELDNALKTPQPLDEKDPERGGWTFGVVNARLLEAQRAASGDGDCIQLIQREQARVSELEETARDLRAQIFKFLEKLRAEDFDETMRQADDVATKWRQVTARGDGWGGLEILTRQHYKHLGRAITSLEEHKARAKDRKSDWLAWQQWSANVVTAHRLVQERGKKLAGATLDDIQEREQFSLNQITTLTEELRAACAEFEKKFNSQPDKGPLSNKAEQEKTKVQDEWQTNVAAGNTRAAAMEEQARGRLDQLERADGPLARLKKAMAVQIDGWMRAHKDRVPPDQNLAVLDREYKAVAAIDPYHEEAQKAAKKLDDLRKRKREEPQGRRFGLFG